MIQVQRFINQLMTSNCYIVYDDETCHAIIIDPASEKMFNEIEFINNKHLQLDYIFLTHEHTDHTWGVNALIDKYDAKVVCSSACKEALSKEGDMYFQLYYDDPNYHYAVSRVDIITDDLLTPFTWNGYVITFIPTPGHSKGSICISIDNYLFTGDTIMQYKPFIDKRSGSKEELVLSVKSIIDKFPSDTIVYPGHGDAFNLKDYD